MKIWYDVSDLVGWKFPHLTGIQRTSVGILNGLTDAGAAVGLVRYEPKAGRFVTLHATSLPQTVRMHLRAPASDDPVAAPHAAQETTQVVEKAVSKPPAGGKGPRRKRLKIKRLFGSDRQSEELRQAFRQFRLASRQLRKSVGDWAASRWSRSRRAADASMPPVTMRSPILTTDTSMEATAFAAPGDVLLSVGATWCLPGYAEATAVARSRGVQIVRMVYDLIPTIKPQWLDPSHTRAITLWVRELLSSSDRVLTISEFSRQEIERYCQECRFETPPLTVVRLGDVMGDGAAAATPAASPRFVPTRPFFVCVSTLDVRKNHRLLYDAWTHLAARRGEDCPDLVCIGLPHLYVADLLREIGQDRSVNRHIHVLHGIEDSELDWYYKHCQSTIYPSKYEGWGLPVAESLGHGRMCLASNASSIPEISSDLPEFFDPYDVHGLVTLVERVLDDPAWVQHREETIRTEFRPTAWRETAAQVLAAIDAPAGRVRLEVWPRSGQEADAVRQHNELTRTLRAA